MMHSVKCKGFQNSLDKIQLGSRARFARILTSIAAEKGRWLTKAILTLLLLGAWQPQWADGLSEEQIKAAYLYNFAKFVEWPAGMLSPNSEILLCVVGNNVLNGALEALNGRNVGEHPLRVAQKNYADLSVTGCHLLYIGDSEQAHFLVILTALGNAPTLTLSDIDEFAEKGGGIGLLFLITRSCSKSIWNRFAKQACTCRVSY